MPLRPRWNNAALDASSGAWSCCAQSNQNRIRIRSIVISAAVCLTVHQPNGCLHAHSFQSQPEAFLRLGGAAICKRRWIIPAFLRWGHQRASRRARTSVTGCTPRPVRRENTAECGDQRFAFPFSSPRSDPGANDPPRFAHRNAYRSCAWTLAHRPNASGRISSRNLTFKPSSSRFREFGRVKRGLGSFALNFPLGAQSFIAQFSNSCSSE